MVVDATLDHQSEGGELVGADVKHFVRVTPVAHVQVTRVELAGKDSRYPMREHGPEIQPPRSAIT